ncbi:hypothetical protein ACWDSJ_23660 [Nocardia sp. NPDC003482]
MNRRIRFAALLAAGLVVGGCGGESSPGTSTSANATSAVTVDLRIANGTVTPTNGHNDAKVGQPIVFVVSSDAEDELHVHASPDHEFEVAAKPDQRFEFTVDVPGQVEVELHHAHRTVTTLTVRP